MAGASGGAKWLVLSKLDRVVAATIVPDLRGPVYLIGSSIGAWRFACYAQDRPLEAIARFEEAYLGQTYSDDPDREEITAKSREILDYVLGESGTAQILSHPVLRTNVMTVRSRHVTASEQPALLVPGLLAAAALNAVTRRSLGAFFDRVLFYDPRDLPPFFDARGFPLSRVELTEANVKDAIVATGSIPMVLSGVRDIAGAPRGIYRDGGVIDYHLDLPQSAPNRLTLYLHFIDRIVPGWFDKKLSWRKPDPSNVDRTILVSPSQEFVARLPYAKIPDRRDFLNFEPKERVRAWRTVVDMCDELADEFHEVLVKDQLAARLEPL
jgi:pimeloyl-ACP methyl ester carboxylesterase